MSEEKSTLPPNRIDRRSREAAKRVIEEALPRPEVRQAVLDLLVESIRHAHAAKDTSWGLTLHPGGVRLNVGPMEAFYFGRQRGRPTLYLVADDEKLPQPDKESLTRAGVEFQGEYKSVPLSNKAIIPLESVEGTLPLLRGPYLSLVEKAARTVKRRTTWYETHSPGVTGYLRSLGYEIEEPDYTRWEDTKQSRGEQFRELFHEFSVSFLNTDKGKKHSSVYEGQREEARRNYDDITARADGGEDVTDLVLHKLLPHANTKGNRERGSWIHVAPAVTKDVRMFFERAGWTKPEDWPKVAEAILRFVRRVVEDPSQLAPACAEFSALPYSKGLQTGFLSPALNALRPEEFLIVNSKSRGVINYFASTSYQNSLTEYPALNAAGHDLIEEFVSGVDKAHVPDGIRDSDLFDMFCHWLVAIRNFNPSSERKYKTALTTRYWKIAPGENAWQWEECRDEGFIAIGWSELGDLSELTREEFEASRDEMLAEHPDWTKEGVEQAWKFAQIREGDRVVANHGTTKVLGVGTVSGPYYFVQENEHGHRVPVRWDDLTPRQVKEEGWRRTLVELDKEKFETIAGTPTTDGGPPAGERDFEVHPSYSLEECAAETGVDEETLARWVRAIGRKGQAVFYGPPGTGKTFVAERVAKHLVAGGNGVLSLVQFHPAYAYEDFVQGIRPQARAGGGLDYPLVPGRFLDFCQKAASRTGTSVLIVDEINRANLARVFGELMYLLEYRDREVPLAGGGSLLIPSNVRIIGTMNTADRSIALVDHALRRRFAFIELAPNFDVLRRYHADRGTPVEGLIETLRLLNQEIGDPHYAVGTSYFLRPDLGEQLEDIWRMEIEPYVAEYFFDRPGKAEAFRWDKVRQRVAG
jgi:hypothetical protein